MQILISHKFADRESNKLQRMLLRDRSLARLVTYADDDMLCQPTAD